VDRHEEALRDFDRAIDLDPDNDWVLYQRALTRQALERTGEAWQDLAAAIGRAKEAHRVDPEDWNNTLNLALYCLAAEETEKADQHYRAAVFGDASPADFRMAVRDLDDLLALFPDHSQARAMRDRLQQYLEEADE
jgi:tetratricopeptide (TPR) repeat protein